MSQARVAPGLQSAASRQPWCAPAAATKPSNRQGRQREEEGGEVKETKLGMASKKDDNFGEWFLEVVVNSDMIEYYNISGCYILRPWAMEIYELLKRSRGVEQERQEQEGEEEERGDAGGEYAVLCVITKDTTCAGGEELKMAALSLGPLRLCVQ